MPRGKKAPAYVPVVDLTPFEGRKVTRARVEVRGVGGGLQEGLDFDPVELSHGDEVYVVIHATCTEVRFDPLPDSDNLVRVHVLRAIESGANFVPEDLVRPHLAQADEERKRIRKERAEAILLAQGGGLGQAMPGFDL